MSLQNLKKMNEKGDWAHTDWKTVFTTIGEIIDLRLGRKLDFLGA